jgi:hypothetical protein
MKQLMLIILLLMTSNMLFSQLNILDERNGFKDLKFGSSITAFNIPEEKISKEYEMITYNTSKLDLKTVFDLKFDDLMLEFENYQLSGIILIKNFDAPLAIDSSLKDVEKLKNNFTQILGEHTNIIEDEDIGNGPVWEGRNVHLFIAHRIDRFYNDEGLNPNVAGQIIVVFNRINSVEKQAGF